MAAAEALWGELFYDSTVEDKIDFVNRRSLADYKWHFINSVWPSGQNSVISLNTERLSCLKDRPSMPASTENTFSEYVMDAFENSPLQLIIHEIEEEDPDPRLLSSSSSGYHSLSGSQAPPSTPTNGSSRRPSLSSSNDSNSSDEALMRRLSLIGEDMKGFDLEVAQLDQQPPIQGAMVPSHHSITKPQYPTFCQSLNNGRTRYGSGRFRRDPIIQSDLAIKLLKNPPPPMRPMPIPPLHMPNIFRENGFFDYEISPKKNPPPCPMRPMPVPPRACPNIPYCLFRENGFDYEVSPPKKLVREGPV